MCMNNLTEDQIKKGGSDQTIKEGHRPLLWFNFYVYFRLPAGIILGALTAFLGSGTDIFSKIDIIISCILFWGLKEKKLWAWKMNFAVLILETITIPITKTSNPTEFIIIFVMIGCCWLLPNWIYFKNRKYLFLS